MKTKIIKTAVGLIRVSTDIQAKTNDSIDGQKKSILKWAKENGVEIVKFYYEPGNSAFRGKRPTLDLIDNEINEGIVTPNAVVVYAFSRFTRNASITGTFKANLMKKDIPILSVTEPMPDDEDSAFISQTVIDMVNELQSRTNSKIVQDRLNDTAEKGYFTGGVVPFGYSSVSVTIANTNIEKKILVVNQKEAKVAREIFNLAEVGLNGKALGVKAIAKHLNQKDKCYRGKRWTKNNINEILNKTLYYGERLWGKKRLTRSNDNPPITIKIPPIITKKKFINVQNGLKARRLTTTNNKPVNSNMKGFRSKTLLVGLLKCQYCGSNLRLMNGKKIKDVNGKPIRYQYYRCPNRTEQGCICPNIRRDHLDKVIIETILLNVLNKTIIEEIVLEIKEKIADIMKNDDNDLLKLHKQQASLKLKINKLYDMVADEVFEMDDTLKENLENKKTILSNVNFSIDEIKTRAKLPLKKFGKPQVEAFVKAAISVLSGTNLENSKQVLLKIIDKILVNKEKIEVFGSNFKIAEFVSKTKMGTSNEVPTFVSIWR
jgi:DNA invertase Pin-like site-specific DNA recombinase